VRTIIWCWGNWRPKKRATRSPPCPGCRNCWTGSGGGAIVTVDALNCQKDIAKKIVSGGGGSGPTRIEKTQ